MAGSRLLVALALLDEAIVIILIVGGAAYAAYRLGLATPLEAALLVSPLALIAAVAAAKAMEAAGLKPRIGREALSGRSARVLEVRGDGSLLVELDGELWRAVSVRGRPRPGGRVRIVGTRGLTLLVEPLDD